jgi:hypothetical protein
MRTVVERIIVVVFMGLFWTTTAHFIGFEPTVLFALASIYAK